MKIKDTKIGAFLKEKAPNVLAVVGDLLPDAGALGIVKNLIETNTPSASKRQELNAEFAELEKEFLKDIQDAREMYKDTDHATADDIAQKVINYNLIIIVLLVVVQVLVVMYVNGQVAAVVTGVVGTIVGSLINERNTVINFFFGSSKSSKDKDKKQAN